MLQIRILKQPLKFLKNRLPKHQKQLALKLIDMRKGNTSDCEKLKGNFYRSDSGEYRIIYEIQNDTLIVILIGKRNDDEIYKIFRQKH